MSGGLFQINGSTIKIGELIIPALVIVGTLSAILIRSFVKRSGDDLASFKTAYDEFAKIFNPAMQELELEESSLNVMMLTEFKQQDISRRNLLRHLSPIRRYRFEKKWAEYKQKYDEVKMLGVFAPVVAIAPVNTDINGQIAPEEVEAWEHIRKEEIHSIIKSLLAIGQKKWP